MRSRTLSIGTRYGRVAVVAALAALTLATAGCGAMVKRATAPMIDNLSTAIMKQKDPELVRDGAPAYLLLIDALVEGSPRDADTLRTAASLYSAYVSAFLLGEDAERAAILAAKARDYAFAAASVEIPEFATLHDKPFVEFAPVAERFEAKDVETLYLVMTTWAGVIQTHAGSWDNLADIAKVRVLAERLLKLDEGYNHGAGHLVMGVLASLLPPALGGKPEEAREHFERALTFAGDEFLPAKVMYAQNYARAVFDRELFERLLGEVVAARADAVPELTLINTLAQRQAKRMLAAAGDYFD